MKPLITLMATAVKGSLTGFLRASNRRLDFF
jgi:hypothetical protein